MNRFQKWIAGWIGLIVGIMCILSFGFIRPEWQLYWAKKCAHQNKKGEMKNGNRSLFVW